MPDGHSPATAKRRLRHDLRALRVEAGLSTTDVVDVCGWSLSKLIRIENGSVTISVTDAMALCSLYQIAGEQRDELVALARVARQPRWWSKHRHVLPPPLQQFLGFEMDATRIRLFQPMVVPGLLQTERYARSVGTKMLSSLGREETDELLTVRLNREQHVLRRAHPPDYTALLDESVLHRNVGGDPDVMIEQLEHLSKLVRDEVIKLGIWTFRHGSHFGLAGGFHILEFDDDADDSVLYLENAHSSVALQDNAELVAKYGMRFDEMMDVAVTGDDAVDFVAAIRETFDATV